MIDLKAGLQIKFFCKSAAPGNSCGLSVVVEKENISFLEAEPPERCTKGRVEEPKVATD